jgi:hypothetical protein
VQHLLLGNTTQTANGVTTRPGPTLDLNFAASLNTVDQVSGRDPVSFTRTTSGTYFDSAGVLRSAAVNLLLRSEEFNALPWATQSTPPTITANTAVSPNGSLTADTITFASADSRLQSDTISFTAGVAYTFSIYARAVGTSLNKFRLAFFDGSQQNSADFTVSNLTWTRITATFIAANTALGRVQIRNATDVLANSLFFWGAQLETGSVATAYIPTTSAINSAPRFDHNPITLESLGLLVEEPRTNWIRNNTMVGAIAGTPGTAPTNWFGNSTASGITRQIVGTGIEDGIAYIDYRIAGTTTGALFFSIGPEPATAVAATNGQTWTFSSYARVMAGSFANFTQLNYYIVYNNSAGTGVQFVTGGIAPTSAALRTQRFTRVATASNATIAFVQPAFQFEALTGAVIDVTVRIGLPQLEQGAFASSVIPTTTGTFTRSADLAQITGSNFGVTRTNLILRSEEFNDAAWTTLALNATVSANQTTAPNGATTADSIADDAVNNVHYIGQSVAVAAATTYTFSCFLRAGTSNFGYLSLSGGGPGWADTFVVNLSTGVGNIQAGSFGSTSIQVLPNGWYRVVVTKITTGAGSPQLRIGVAQSLSVTSYSGSGSTIFAWGAQLETGSAATAYIPTTTTAASVLDSWYRQSEGTLFAEWIRGYSGNFTNFTSPANLTNNLSGASANNIAAMATNGTNLQIYQTMATGGAEQLDYAFENAATRNKTVQAYRLNDSQSAINGILKNADTSCTPPSGLDRLNIGSGAIGTAYINSHIRRITYYPVRIPSALLQAITV